MKRSTLGFLLILFATLNFAEASELLKDFDSLGGNSDLYKKAKALNPEIRTEVIQKRIVDRRLRLEVAPSVMTYWGGNPYISSRSAGVEANFHLTPRWSLDLSYQFGFQNDTSTEGDRYISATGKVPDVDPISTSIMGFVTYYPFYGKLNLFNNVVHFDIYTSLGAGTSELASGNQSTLGANVGMGIWWSQHLSTRIGYRYQTYEAQLKTGPDSLDQSAAYLAVGYLL